MNSDPEPPESGANSDLSKLAGQYRQQNIPRPAPIPDHEMLRCIGQGSYGSVWLARNLMGVYRAVKIVYRNAFDSSRPFERELSGIRKFEPISRSHAGFVDVLHIGQNEQEGCFYYVMELADDETHGQQIDPQNYKPLTLSKSLAHKGRLPVADCVKLGLDLSQALSELHRNGLVHRDVKPANIVFCDTVPKLADIGLVTESNKEVSYVGTEGFIPPEGPGSAQADIFSLGKVLYEAATGKDRLDFPAMPADLDKMPDAASYLELNEVILKACETKTDGRYTTAWDMHADLVVLANGKSVQRLRALERGVALLKRVVALSAVVLFCAGIIGFEIYRGKETARKNRERLVGEKVANWTAATESGDMLGALVSSADALLADSDDPVNGRDHRLRFGSALERCPKLTYFAAISNTHYASGGHFWSDGDKVMVSRYGAPIEIHDLATGEIDNTWPPVNSDRVSISGDGRRMATGDKKGQVWVWDLQSRRQLCYFKEDSEVDSVALNQHGDRLLVARDEGPVELFDMENIELLLQLPESTNGTLHCVFNHKGNRIVTAGKDHITRLYDAGTGELVDHSISSGRWFRYAAFSPDDSRLAVAGEDHTVRFFDVTVVPARPVAPELKHRDVVLSVEYSPDGRLIVTASLDGTVRLWTAEDHQPLWPNPKLELGERGQYATFDAEGNRVLAISVYGTTRIFDLAGSLRPPTPEVWPFSGDKKRYLIVGKDELQVKDSISQEPVSLPVRVPAPIIEAGLDQQGLRAIVRLKGTGSNAPGPAVIVYRLDTGKIIGRPLLTDTSLTNLTLSPDARLMAIREGTKVSIVDLESGAPACPPISHSTSIVEVLWFPDSGRIATMSTKEVRVCHTTNGLDCFRPLEPSKPNHDFADFELSPNGSRFVVCEREKYYEGCSAIIRNSANGEPVGKPLDHTDGVLSALFSGDAQWVATAGEDFKVRIWSAISSLLIAGPLQHEHQVRGVNFNSDSTWVATASTDRTARIWRRDNGQPLTPPLRSRFKLDAVAFLDSDSRVAVTTFRETNAIARTWIWNLPIESRPLEDIEALAHFLNGTLYSPPGGNGSGPDQTMEAAWTRLRARYPNDFSTTRQDLIAWHQYEADLAEDAGREGRDQSAIQDFHLKRLEQLEQTKTVGRVPGPSAKTTSHKP